MIKLLTTRHSIAGIFVIALIQGLASNLVLAGAHTEEEIQLEISYLAMKLLEIKAKDSYTLESKALIKPYIGICSTMKKKGIYLSCVTPASQGAKAGLKTGDMVLSINGVSMANQQDYRDPDGDYWKITDRMKIGDELVLELVDGDKTRELTVTVGSLSHPAYRIEISKTEIIE